jgi:dihydroxy-acid dehydratase
MLSEARASLDLLEPEGNLKRMDWILVILGVLFLATLTAFFLGIIPYPIGWIVLAFLFSARLLQIKNRNRSR